MKLKGKILLIEKKATHKQGILEYQSEYEQRVNEGVIVQVGVDVMDDDYKPGVKIYFRGYEAIDIEDTSRCLIESKNILAVED